MRVLIVDDEKTIRQALLITLESAGHETAAASTGKGALEEMRRETFDVVFLDLKLSQESGLDILEDILKKSPQTAVVMVTAFASVETAVEAMRRGAFDYVPKPCTPEQIRQVLARIERTRKLERRVVELESQISAESPEMDISTTSPVMEKALEVAFKAASSEATVLLLGESGTGKSVLARAIHRRSRRAAGAFVTVSCPSLSRELLESDLFGHVKGAFTGALAETWGKVTAAEGGTLFLDEIGDLPLEIQARILRLLQEREYERVGETVTRRANVRLIAATNRNLQEAVAKGKFREDLFYRLNVITLMLPPLRERAGDIERLAGKYLQFAAAHSGKKVMEISAAALAALRSYAWPGNLRELHNVIERAVILNMSEEIQPGDLAETVSTAAEPRIGGEFTLQEIEDAHLQRVIASSKSLEEAAGILGIDPATLYRRRKKLSGQNFKDKVN